MLVAALFDRHALGAGFDHDAVVAQNVEHALHHVRVFAGDDMRRLFDHGDLRAEAAVHLREFEPDVTAADDDQMLPAENRRP